MHSNTRIIAIWSTSHGPQLHLFKYYPCPRLREDDSQMMACTLWALCRPCRQRRCLKASKVNNKADLQIPARSMNTRKTNALTFLLASKAKKRRNGTKRSQRLGSLLWIQCPKDNSQSARPAFLCWLNPAALCLKCMKISLTGIRPSLRSRGLRMKDGTYSLVPCCYHDRF